MNSSFQKCTKMKTYSCPLWFFGDSFRFRFPSSVSSADLRAAVWKQNVPTKFGPTAEQKKPGKASTDYTRMCLNPLINHNQNNYRLQKQKKPKVDLAGVAPCWWVCSQVSSSGEKEEKREIKENLHECVILPAERRTNVCS